MVYVDYVLVISCVPMETIKGIKCIFKLKEDESEPPDMYLGASPEQVKKKGGTNVGQFLPKNMSKPLS